MRPQRRNQSVPGFVISGHPLLLVGQQHRLALGAHQHLVLRLLEIDHQHRLAVVPRRIQRRLVHHVRQIGARETRRSTRQNTEIDIVRKRHFARMNPQHLFAPPHIGTTHNHAPIEAPRPQ